MSQRFRVAVIGETGRGNYGHQIDTAWLTVPEAEVVAVADTNAEGRAQAARRLSVDQTFADYRKMLDVVRPDIVAIGPRWIDQHRDMAVAAAERGVHIYIEKPFCRSPSEADEIVRTCEMSHVFLVVAHPTRYSPMTASVRRLVRDGAIGEVLELRARGKEDRRGGAEDLWVLGTHLLDLVLALGYTPQWCFASVLTKGLPLSREHVVVGNEGLGPLAGDAVRAMYGLEQGMTATFQSSRHAEGKPSRYGLKICGSKGIIEILEGAMPDVWILQDPSWSPGRSGQAWQRVSSTGIGQPEPLTDPLYQERHRLAIHELLKAIETRQQPRGNMYEARQVIEMIAAVFESQRIGGPVSFPLTTRVNPLTLL